MKDISYGARQAVRNCMKIDSSDRVVIVGDKQSENIARALRKESELLTSTVNSFTLENYGIRPLSNLPDEIRDAVSNSTAVFYIASSQPGEKVSLRRPIIQLAKLTDRQAHMPDVTEEMMLTGMSTDYSQIKDLSRKLFGILTTAKEVRVTTKLGTDFYVRFNPAWKWIICDGDISSMESRWSNLPDGEVFTSPAYVGGQIVVDGSIGDYFEKFNPLREPIYLDVKDNRVVSLKTKNSKLQSQLRAYISQDKNANRIGEFAMGTNIGLERLIGNMLQDEKFPGVHIAIGDSYPDETGAPFPSKAHCDMVITKPTVVIDGREIMKDGKYLI